MHSRQSLLDLRRGQPLTTSAARLTLGLALLGIAASPGRARADEYSTKADVSAWTFSWGGYVHVAYRWIQQPTNYQLAGRNNGFQLEQARVGANVLYKGVLAARVSIEGASEDRLSQALPGGKITARLRDAYITYAPLRALRFTVGQMVTPWDLDSMRSDAELAFVSRAVPVEGVQASEGRTLRGLGQDRNLGLSIHSGDIGLGPNKRSSIRYSVFIGNGNGENQLLNDNNLPAVFGRMEYAFWGKAGIPEDQIGPIRARSDGRKPTFGLGIAGQYNPRTLGNLPDLINETDGGVAADLLASFFGVDLQGGVLYVRTVHQTLSAVPDLERFGWWGHLRYMLPRIPLEIVPGYRIASFAPRAHLQVQAATAADAQQDADLALLYHTFGVSLRPTRDFPLHLDVNYTLTTERGSNVLANDRFEADVVAVF